LVGHVLSLISAVVTVRQPVTAIAANDRGALALTADEVRLLDGEGFPLRGFALGQPPPRARARRGGERDGFAAAAGVLSDGDFNDAYDPDSDVEDPENILVEDDAATKRARPDRRTPSTVVALAVAGKLAWMGRADGLWRAELEGERTTRVLPEVSGPIHAVAVGVDGRTVVAASDQGLFRSRDEGETFQRVASLDGAVARLAVTASGVALVLDGRGLRRIGADQTVAQPVPLLDANDVSACGDVALVLSGGRLFAIADGGAGEPTALDGTGPPDAQRITCSPDGALWVGYRPGLWTSIDQGRSWVARDDLPPAPVADVSVTKRSLWLAGPSGLVVLPRVPVIQPPPLAGASRELLPVSRVRPPSWHWWLPALPRVDLGFASAQSSTRHDVRAFLLVTFSFDGHRALLADRRRFDAEYARHAQRDESERVLMGNGGTFGSLDDDERRALAQVLEE
jgi:hypothetical protein